MNSLQYVSVDSDNGSAPQSTGRSTWSDRLVIGRESFLDVITGTISRAVLNAGEPGPLGRSDQGADLTAEMKRSMDMVRIGAIDGQGLNVDYRQLKENPVYLEYRRICSPRLKIFDPAQLTTREEKLAF